MSEAAYGFAAEFWNAKVPTTWTDEEVHKLLTKSPWSRQITIDVPNEALRTMGVRVPRGQDGQVGAPRGATEEWASSHQVSGTVRWESAQPVREATNAALPGQFANHYAISVTGFNLGDPGVSGFPDGASSSNFTKSFLGHIRAATSLTKKGKPPIQAALVHGAGSAVLLGFSKRSLQLSQEDCDVEFATTIVRMSVKTKFDFKEMMYHETLAV